MGELSDDQLSMLTLLYLLLIHTLQLLAQTDPPHPSVTAPAGTFIGSYLTTRDQKTISAFLGIPFAVPPVNKLRFDPPQPLSPQASPYHAQQQPPACPMVGDSQCSEDCLYLNVYTPIDPPSNSSSPLLPVYVWFYGGAFEIGSAYGYTHEFIMDEDVVFVVPQYRLGLFGFLSTGDEVVPGNMGLKDLRLALRWVQKNIASFGGDPTKVTIGGQSAGAVSVHYMVTFVHNEGLFRAAISESATSLESWAFRPPDEVTRMVQKISNLTGCPTDSESYVKCLRALSQDDITTLYTIKYKNTMYPGTENFAAQMIPLIGGVIESECVRDRLVLGNPWQYKTNVPYLMGVNSKEAITAIADQLNDRTNVKFKQTDATFDTFFPLVINYQSSQTNGSSIPPDVRTYYLNDKPISRDNFPSFIDAASDALFLYGVYESAKRARQKQTYFYYFDYVGANELFPIPDDSRVGPAHTDELFFFFEHPNTLSFPRVNTTSDDNLSRQLVKLWIQFVTYLDPTPSKLDQSGIGVKWVPFGNNESYLHINETGFSIAEGFLPGRMTFWQEHPFPYSNEKYSPQSCSQLEVSVKIRVGNSTSNNFTDTPT